jgi:hypothetical protein
MAFILLLLSAPDETANHGGEAAGLSVERWRLPFIPRLDERALTRELELRRVDRLVPKLWVPNVNGLGYRVSPS